MLLDNDEHIKKIYEEIDRIDQNPDETEENVQWFNAFESEYDLPFTPSPQLQVVFQRTKHFAHWYLDAKDRTAVGGLPDD